MSSSRGCGARSSRSKRDFYEAQAKESFMLKKHVLVVDDSPTDRQIVTTLLQKQGYEVTTAVDGEDALEKIASERPPLIVLDIILPKMNGYQVLRQLKTAPETRHIKVILVSSKNQE